MAKKAGKSLSSAVKAGVRKHRKDETRMGFVQIPGGINNGIAKLTECKFGQYQKGTNEGEWYFSATGIVLSPDKNDAGVPVKGLRTSIMIGIHDHKRKDGSVWRDTEESIGEILNEMRKLGLDTSDLDESDLEDAAAELKEAAPTFRFSTTSTKVGDRTYVNERWSGAVEYQEDDEDEEDDIEDDIQEDEEDDVEEDDENEEDEEDEEDEEEVDDPEAGEVYYTKIDGESVEVMIEKVFKRKKTVDVSVEETGDKIKGLAWSALRLEG